MNTLKSAALLVVLIGVLYGVYVALNKPLEPQHSDVDGGGSGSPLVEFEHNNTFAPPATAPAFSAQPEVNSGSNRSFGGEYPTSTTTPPTTLPSTSPPLTPASNTIGSLSRSGYETSADNPASSNVSPASSPALEMTPAAAPSATGANEVTPTTPALASYALRGDMAEAEQLVASGKYRDALAKLTPHYSRAELPSEQRTVLFSWLDSLAAKVIYSREHLLAPGHVVRKGETLYDIANQYKVEHRLLQNINSREVSDPQYLVPSIELKVVPGPFHAEVNLTTSEITLFVGDLYAGRFPFTVGDQPPQPADYKVVDKRSQQKTYIGFDGRMIPANDPANPYGGWWISLGGEVAIHGSPTNPGPKTLGCIALSPQDAKDIYGILSISSDVKIRR